MGAVSLSMRSAQSWPSCGGNGIVVAVTRTGSGETRCGAVTESR